jgi:hypothetical protein
MKITITYQPQDNNYRWKLITGPDEVDHYEGIADSVGGSFEKILIVETLNSQHYYGGTEND